METFSIQNRLEKILFSQKIPHAILFTGSKKADLEKHTNNFASRLLSQNENHEVHLAKVLSGNHPDLHIYKPEGKTGMHSIHSMRSLCQTIALLPHQTKLQCFIVFDAERMLPTSSNALLKTLEEPPARSVIILVSSFPDRLLPTLISRCQRFSFTWEEKNLDALLPIQQKLIEKLPDQLDFSVAEEIGSCIDEEKKKWEKELRALLPQDASLLQRETIEKEIEGEISLRYQENANLLFLTLLQWHRDRLIIELKLDETLLIFPHQLSQIKRTPFYPLFFVEKAIEEARIGMERGIKLTTCLEALFFKLIHK